ncbi:MAG: APC family permease [Candidatus Omnitrophica bacterium]|nr:APC family permease [Candidatus Omnitrophota bacterium]
MPVPFLKKIKNIVIGKSKNIQDRGIFHKLSLIAFFAWVGLGADGLSSSCYGPEAAFLALGEHKHLGIFVAILTALTVFLISASYSQIIELFPTGGGGYLVASRLLNPNLGMISGCALLIDYVLTIAISVASGADALFSFLPAELNYLRFYFALFGVIVLMFMNMRGTKESIVPLTPIFLIFLITHIFAIGYAVFTHLSDIPIMTHASMVEMGTTHSNLGLMGLMFIILSSYSLGAGTFTGIEAVSNGMYLLREPKVETGKMTMRYMAFSLAFTVTGLMFAYLLFNLNHESGKTLNAVLFENITQNWPAPSGQIFVLVTLISEAMLLFVAAQAGFLGGPGVLANMAMDRWMPSRFSSLSDRLVTQNGVILMGFAALITVAATHGSVHLLVVLYSINVFITFCLSQAGMVRHWWQVRTTEIKWKKKILINGLGLLSTTFILVAMTILKFHDGGWITLVVTASLVVIAILIKRHYKMTLWMLRRLNSLVDTTLIDSGNYTGTVEYDPQARTAAVLVNGYNGLGLHTLMSVVKTFGNEFKNYVFIQVGVVDARNFKGNEELDNLKTSVQKDLDKYIKFMNKNGYYAEGYSAFGTEVIDEVENLVPLITERYKQVIFFGGQLVFPNDTLVNRILHNGTVFAIQKRFYQKGIPFMILPIRV